MKLINVLIQYSILNLDKTFLYYSTLDVKPYTRVLISFGSSKKIYGFVVSVKEDNRELKEIEKEYGFQIKEIDELIDNEPIIDDSLFLLAKEIASFYISPLIGVIKTMLPSSLRPSKLGASSKIKYCSYLKINRENISNFILNKNETRLIERYFLVNNEIKDTLNNSKSLQSLIDKNIITRFKKEEYRYRIVKSFNYEDKIILSSIQEKAYNNIISSPKLINLLYGITGSGKTEIYIKLIEHYINEGKSCLILVPEIGLTPLMISRIISYFSEDLVGILHSSLTNNERYDEYRKIKNGKTRIVVGTRSAIFAPLKNLGLIIIDEEHDESYKQENDLCYSAIDVSLLRAKECNCKVVLGSATPSIEDMCKAKNNKYNLVVVDKKYNDVNKASVELIDRKDASLFTYSTIFSLELIRRIKEALNKNEQIIIFVNNKGYARSYYCRGCGKTYVCPTCNTPLFLHKEQHKLKCHRCNYEERIPTSCKECGSTFFGINGFGIDKVKEEFENLFSVPYLVLDGDVTKNDDELRTILEKFNNKECNVLIGTQTVCKGHDFNDVSLVCVLNADSLFNYPSYKSSFNAFSLIEQLIGRAGRRKNNSLALIQTSQLNNKIINYAINNDYLGFYEYEITNRKTFKYPPFYNLLTIKLSSKNSIKLKDVANKLANVIKEFNSSIIVLGPSLIKKEINKFVVDLTLKSKKKADLTEISKILISSLVSNNSINISFVFSKLD